MPRSAARRVSSWPSRTSSAALYSASGLVALAFQIEHAAQVNVRPGEQPLIFAGGEGLLKLRNRLVDSFLGIVFRFAGMPVMQIDAGQDEVGASGVGRGRDGVGLLREHLLRHGAGRAYISGGQPRLSQIEPGELARLAALQHVFVGFFVELGLARAVHLLIHVHAVHHFADGVFQAGWFFSNWNICS